MNEKFDIFIPVAPKDYNKVKFLIKSIDENIEGFENIYITTPEGDRILDDPRITYFRDKEILDINPLRFNYRPGWLYQMYLKMFQQVTKNDLFLTVDSDLIFNRKVPMFNNEGKPIWWMGWEQNHQPYFRFQEKILNLPRVHNHTFINDMNFMKKSIIDEMLKRNNFTIESFCEASFPIINSSCFPGEPEIYGNYVAKYYPNMYEFREAKTSRDFARSQNHIEDTTAQIWSDEDYFKAIESCKSKDFDMIMLHSWLDNNFYNWN